MPWFNFTSRLIRYVLLFIILCMPILTTAFWLYFESLPAYLILHFVPLHGYAAVFTKQSQLFGFLASLLPISVVMYGLFTLARIFSNYANNNIFDNYNTALFKRLGYSCLAFLVAYYAYNILVSLAFSAQAMDFTSQYIGEIYISISDFFILLLSFLFFVMAWVTKVSCNLAEDHLQII